MTDQLKRIAEKCLDDYYHIFLAFDVVDGDLSRKEYFEKVKQHNQ